MGRRDGSDTAIMRALRKTKARRIVAVESARRVGQTPLYAETVGALDASAAKRNPRGGARAHPGCRRTDRTVRRAQQHW